MSNLVIWYGIPGSGKSTRLEPYRTDGYSVFDDFMAKSICNVSGFPYARHFVEIVSNLRTLNRCVISDIKLGDRAFRAEVSEILNELVPGLSLKWHCFDCYTAEAIEICRDNVRFRAETTGRDSADALRKIDELAPNYSIANGARVYQVVRARR